MLHAKKDGKNNFTEYAEIASNHKIGKKKKRGRTRLGQGQRTAARILEWSRACLSWTPNEMSQACEWVLSMYKEGAKMGVLELLLRESQEKRREKIEEGGLSMRWARTFQENKRMGGGGPRRWCSYKRWRRSCWCPCWGLLWTPHGTQRSRIAGLTWPSAAGAAPASSTTFF